MDQAKDMSKFVQDNSTKLHFCRCLVEPAKIHRRFTLVYLFGAVADVRPRPTVMNKADALTEKVDAIFAQWDKPDSPGCALGVIKDAKLIYRRGYGSANLDYNVPISSESVFYIASTSKQFTAASILLLARRGTISLDDDIRKYFPEIPKYESPITIRHLIHHTSGIRDYLELMSMAGRSFEDAFDNQDAVEVISRQRGLNFKPGDQHLYSNSNYVLLAEIVRRATGKSLREFAEENLFRPLGMTSTLFNDDRTVIVKNRVVSYGMGTNAKPRYFIKNINAMGDGNLLTTVEDLARWDQNFYDNRVGGSGFSEQMLTRGKLNSGEELSYAFGLSHGEYRGLKTVSHGGGFLGFRTEMVRFPEQKFTVICLCNSGAISPGALANRVADLYLAELLKPTGQSQGRQSAPANQSNPAQRPEPTATSLEEFAGSYYSEELDATYRLSVEEGKLQLRIRKALLGSLSPQLKDEFLLRGMRFVFSRDAHGKAAGFVLNAGRVRGVRFERKSI